VSLRRIIYRVRQFAGAVVAHGRSLTQDERAEVRMWLPAEAWRLFDAMPRNDQRHSLNVLHALAAAGHDELPLMQAALLHDVAKISGGVKLFHRIAVVLLKIARPDWADRMAQAPAPDGGSRRYPFWAHANHPQLGAEMAAAAGCDPLAVALIHRHQETGEGAEEQRGSGKSDRLLAALQAADDDN
jgi:hypothetical protein